MYRYIYARINVQIQTYSLITADSQEPVVRHVYVLMLYTGGTIGMKGKGMHIIIIIGPLLIRYILQENYGEDLLNRKTKWPKIS